MQRLIVTQNIYNNDIQTDQQPNGVSPITEEQRKMALLLQQKQKLM
jgi:hypothetical protein